MELQKILKEKLKNKNISAVARNINLSPALLHDWVSGRRRPSFKNLKHLKALSKYLNITLSELLGEKHDFLHEFSFFLDGIEYVIRVGKRF